MGDEVGLWGVVMSLWDVGRVEVPGKYDGGAWQGPFDFWDQAGGYPWVRSASVST